MAKPRRGSRHELQSVRGRGRTSLERGLVKTDERSKENTAIPMIREQVVIEGCMVRKDSKGSQYKKAEQQEKRKADGLFSQQEKQGRQYEGEEEYLQDLDFLAEAGKNRPPMRGTGGEKTGIRG